MAACEYMHGKWTKRKVSRAVVDDDLVLDKKRQTLHTDVMHIDGQRFLVTVCEPSCLTLQAHIERESQTVLGRALQEQLKLL
jgi:hypothetical protein